MRKITINDKKRLAKIILIVSTAAIALIMLCWFLLWNHYYNVKPISKEKIEEIKKGDYNKLMIVAHPDDEMLWGGAHLLDGGYYVVCLTRGYDKERKAEFEEILELTGNDGIILSYPDKVLFRRDDWKYVIDDIRKDIESIVEAKDWELIVTHNKAGEYGHKQHKKTNRIVTQVCSEDNYSDKLFYFGKYYRRVILGDYEDELTRISDDKLEQKQEILKVYESQKDAIEGLSHMNPYEMWQKSEK